MTTTIDFNKVYKANHRQIQNHIFKMVHDLMVAEELTSDVFMKVHKTLDRFDETKSKLSTWIYNIATHVAIDYLRKGKLNTKSIHDTFENNDGETIAMDFDSNEATPLDQLIMQESTGNLTSGLNRLPAVQAEMLMLLAKGFTYEEIAKTLNMPCGTIKAAIHIARTKMKSYFQRSLPVVA